MPRILRLPAGTIGAVAAVLLAYALAGMIGGMIPANPRWHPPTDGVRIYVEDNGIHIGLVLPLAAAGVDWGEVVRPEHLRDPRYANHRWRSFGWGDRAFYLDTPTWSDVNPLTIARAATGSDATVLHVDALPAPKLGPGVRTIMLRPEEYRRLAGFIRASFGEGRSRYGYGSYDVFYPARGRYSAARTCNAWAGEALRHAGVRMGAWTPFPITVMAWLPPN